MFGTTRAWPTGAGLLLGMVLLLGVPQAALAAEQHTHGGLLARGAGFAKADGSPRVKLLQRRLRVAGERPGPIDGRFGPRTERAVRRAQRHWHVKADGVVGPRTRSALAARLAAVRGRTDAPAPAARVNRPAEAPAATPVASSPAGEEGRPWILIGLVAAGLGLGAALLVRYGVTLMRRRHPAPAIVPLGRGLELAGESEDPGIGPFSGTAYAVEIPELRDKEKRAKGSRFYVLDPTRKLPFWVRYAEVHTPLPPALQAHPEPWELQGALRPGAAVLGYVTVPTTYPERHAELFAQIELIERLCKRRGFRLIGVVRDENPGEQETLERPGIIYALEQFAADRASGLVVSDVARLGRSRSEIDDLLGRLSGRGVSLLTLDPELDTSTAAGEEAVRTIAAVGSRPRPATNGGRQRRLRVRGNGNGNGVRRQGDVGAAGAVESGT
jgi:peptidoglycan hydrolase-like protein with peptidoglycan-binding domain